MVGVLGDLVGVLGVLVGIQGVLVGIFDAFVGLLGVVVGVFCSKQFLLRSLWKKVRQLEKSTPPPVVAVVTNMSYENKCSTVCENTDFVKT